MSTNDISTPSKMQTKLQTMADGLTTSTYALLSSLVVLGSTLSKAEIIAKLKAWVALYAATVQAKHAYVTALAARTAAETAMHSFYTSLVIAVKQVAGPTNASLLGSVGITPAKARKASSTETKSIAQAKSKATRQARGTMGKRQRMAITTTPGLRVQVIPAATPSVTNATPSSMAVTSATPTATSAVPAASSTVPTAASTPLNAPASVGGPQPS